VPRVRIEPFTIAVEDELLADLRDRIHRTRWPDQLPDIGWDQGTELGYLHGLLSYWAGEFDWRAQERRLNGFEHFTADIDGTRIHFVHERARGERQGIPLILTHGWPSSFVEYLELVPLLTDPEANGIDGPAFDLVIPSLPGYGFSERPARTGINTRHTAGLWHQLMRGLGYTRYGTGGGDFGAGVASFMALDDPDSAVLGVHLTNLELSPYTGPGSKALTDDEQRYLAQVAGWDAVERGYSSIQSTKPQTVGYGLTDSPAGLAAWILEKWRSWTDSHGDLDAHFERDFLLTMLTVYWVSGSITTTLRDYYDNRWHAPAIGPDDFIDAPTAIAVFASQHVHEGDPPREWVQRLYDVRRFTPMPSGGHFAPAEEPGLVARDIAAFFGDLST
jgi:pimeloyl-ACP methyl ester carboxylesterase